MLNGRRLPRVLIDAYAMARGGPRHVRTKHQAEQWAARIQLDWINGHDPRLTPHEQAQQQIIKVPMVADLIRAYREFYVPDPDKEGRQIKPVQLKQPQVVRSELRHIEGYCGTWPATDLEDETLVKRFVTALYEGWSPTGEIVERGESGVTHLLRRLRTVINWGRHQHPPFLSRTPIHRHGITIAEEDTRTRRLFTVRDGDPWDEQQALLDACAAIDDADHQFAGRQIRRRILGALETAARGSELDRVRLSHLVLTSTDASLTFAGRSRRGGKAKDDRKVPFDPNGALAEVLRPRLFLKAPHDYLFGDEEGRRINHYKAWLTVRLLGWGLIARDGTQRTPASDQAALEIVDLEFRDLRRECASRWWEGGVKERKIQILLGHSTLVMTQRYLQIPQGGDDLKAEVAQAMGWGTEVKKAGGTTTQLRPTGELSSKRRKNLG